MVLILLAPPVNGVIGACGKVLPIALTLPTTVPNVVAGLFPATGPAVVTAGFGAGDPATKSTLGLVTPGAAGTVSKPTCGTITWVTSKEVQLEAGA